MYKLVKSTLKDKFLIKWPLKKITFTAGSINFFFLLFINLSVSHFIDKAIKRIVTSAMKKELWILWTTHKCSVYFQILFQPIPLTFFDASIANCALTLCVVFSDSLCFCHKKLSFLGLISDFFSWMRCKTSSWTSVFIWTFRHSLLPCSQSISTVFGPLKITGGKHFSTS